MPLKWVNIRNGLRTVAETEPQIAALWGSSDRSPNAFSGQDFGWRLAEEVAVELKHIKGDLTMLERIAQRFKKSAEEINEIDILHYISNKTKLESAPEPDLNQFEDEYNARIRSLEGKDVAPRDLFADETIASPASLSTEELIAELARRQAGPSTTDTTTKK